MDYIDENPLEEIIVDASQEVEFKWDDYHKEQINGKNVVTEEDNDDWDDWDEDDYDVEVEYRP
jgi:GTP-binding protein